MRRAGILACCACLWAAFSAGAITIKLGSLAPIGSPWDDAIHRIASEWQQISGGSVEVKIYSGGVAGDEPDMVRKIRIGQLSAAAITVSGLQGIFNGLKVLSFPLFVRSDGELQFVLDHMKNFFAQQLESRGFKVVMWSTGGWVYFFSRYPIVTPDDLRKQKLWVWVGDPDEVQAWQSSGFPVVPLAATDIMTSLEGGMIDAFVTSPLLAASNQWFGIANNMCGLRLGPLWGALVVSTRTWSQIPAELQSRLVEAAQRIADSLGPQINNADASAIAVMSRYGLKISQVPSQAESQWEGFIDKGFSELIGKSFDRASYDMAKKLLDEYLAGHPRK